MKMKLKMKISKCLDVVMSVGYVVMMMMMMTMMEHGRWVRSLFCRYLAHY